MYLNVDVLFISEYPLYSFYVGKSISEKFWLEISVCNFFGCNEDISINIFKYLPILHIMLN